MFFYIFGKYLKNDGVCDTSTYSSWRNFFVKIFSHLSFDMQTKTNTVSYRKLVVLFKKKIFEIDRYYRFLALLYRKTYVIKKTVSAKNHFALIHIVCTFIHFSIHLRKHLSFAINMQQTRDL